MFCSWPINRLIVAIKNLERSLICSTGLKLELTRGIYARFLRFRLYTNTKSARSKFVADIIRPISVLYSYSIQVFFFPFVYNNKPCDYLLRFDQWNQTALSRQAFTSTGAAWRSQIILNIQCYPSVTIFYIRLWFHPVALDKTWMEALIVGQSQFSVGASKNVNNLFLFFFFLFLETSK